MKDRIKALWSNRRIYNLRQNHNNNKTEGNEIPGSHELQDKSNPTAPTAQGVKNGHRRIIPRKGADLLDDLSSSDSGFREFINFGEEDQMEIEGFELCRGKMILTWIFIVLSAGLLRLIFHWWPQLMLYSTHRKCRIGNADKILVIEHYQQKYKRYHVKKVYTVSAELFSTSAGAGVQKSLKKELNDNVIHMDYDGKNRKKNIASGIFKFLHKKLFNVPSRTKKLFAAAGLPKDQVHNESTTWDQRLEQELQSINSPKLAIPTPTGTIREMESVRLFTCKKLRYIWDENYGSFVRLQGFDQASTQNLHNSNGLSIFQQCQRRIIYGNNEIRIQVQSIVKLLFLEVLNPFYCFQIFSVSLWLSDGYIYFSFAIIIMSVFGITSTIIQTRQNQKKLRTTVQSSDIVTVCRGSRTVSESVPTDYLVPGDLIEIPKYGCIMHCDVALLSGNCIVNESMLTGESVPITKTPLPNRPDVYYNTKEHSRHTLFCGTQIMQTRYYGNEKVFGVVLRSGFLTSKGSLVRSILYPPPVDYKFEKDSYKFVAVLACIAFVGFIFSIFTKLKHGETVRNIIVDSLDLITIVVPPALPAAMTVGRLYAQRRLQKQGIYCISPRAINVSGSIDCVCFDKTGTLTEEGLDIWGTLKVEKIGPINSKPTFLSPEKQSTNLSGPLAVGMAACHSITMIDDNLIGDPLDLKMFEWTGWTLEEPEVVDNEKFDMLTPTIVRPPSSRKVKSGDSQNADIEEPEIGEVGIIRQFTFTSSLQRMSCITRHLGAQDFELFCKGSPEMITSLSHPDSVPENFQQILEKYTQQGYRVIAIGHRKLSLNYAKVQRVLREEVECDLQFLGLIVMDNRLKPETTGVMRTLKNAAIRTIMVTGDNMQTAISVARDCGMLETSDKVIVLNTEFDNGGLKEVKIPRLTYTIANKVTQSELNSSTVKAPGVQLSNSSSISSFGGNSLATLEGNFNIETPLNRYHIACTGNAFAAIRTHYPELLPRILVRGTVFARMSPDQKQQLVELLQGLGYFVGMCGDGANDCGALKAAHAGISLSDQESSVASPFTSKEPNITCIPHLIREGRAALVTSFGIFKYMAVYSLTQFVSVIILYTISSNLSDIQFLYIDLFLISVFALFFGRTEPCPGPLVKQPPSASLVSFAPVFSIVLHMIAIVGVQALAFIYVQNQPWFIPFKKIEDEEVEHLGCWENYAIFAVSTFQYIIMAVIFSRGKPYRKSFYTNPGLLSSVIIMTCFTIYLNLIPCSWLQEKFQIVLPPEYSFTLILFAFGFANLILAILIENGIINFILAKVSVSGSEMKGLTRSGSNSKFEYVRIDHELNRTDWPPIGHQAQILNHNDININFQNEKKCKGNGNEYVKQNEMNGIITNQQKIYPQVNQMEQHYS